jgi:nucleotide-binding universal stress UspA family protein
MNEHLVVVGVDGSPASYTALRWALHYAARTPGTRVRAVRCWLPIRAGRWEAAVTAHPVPSHRAQRARAGRELDQVVAAALAGTAERSTPVAVRQRVVHGTAGPVLVADSADADLLVLGHNPRSRTNRLHRSVSGYCARHAACPVLVIPPSMATQRTPIHDSEEVPA